MQRAVSMSTLYVVYAIYLGADGIKNVIYEIVSAAQHKLLSLENAFVCVLMSAHITTLYI